MRDRSGKSGRGVLGGVHRYSGLKDAISGSDLSSGAYEKRNRAHGEISRNVDIETFVLSPENRLSDANSLRWNCAFVRVTFLSFDQSDRRL